MAYARPDLLNLRMQSVEDFKTPLPAIVKTVTPPPEKNHHHFAASLDLLRSSLSSSSRATSPVPKTSTPPSERNNQSHGASLGIQRLPPSSVSRSPTPPITDIAVHSPEKSNNPYINNNPWLSSTGTSDNNTASSSRPDLSRYKSYSLDLPRPKQSPSSTTTEFPVESARNSLTLTRPTEDGNVAAAFGLGPLHDIKEFVEYEIWNASLTNMRVCPVELDGQYFYIAHRSFLPNRPGVVVHSGTTKDGNVMGVAHLDFFSTSNPLGVGDPKGAPMAVVWEKLHKESFWTHMRYSFTWDVVETVKGLTETEKHVFEWHRTKNNFLWDDQGDLVLVEKGKDEVLALYEGKGTLGQLPGKRRGTLKIKPRKEGFVEGWETMVLLGWASIVELSRRRARTRRVNAIFGHI